MSGTPDNPDTTSDIPPLRVLLVEDSENDALLLLRELRRGGYEPVHERVYTPEDMERALRGADERGEPWEIVISDYYMPRFRAPEALRLLRRLGYDTPFIVVSGKVGEEAAVEVMRAGAQDYITKENMVRLNPAMERELREATVRRERVRAEEALGRSENRFQRLVEQAADAVFVYHLDGSFVDVNRRACESLGYTREELLTMSVADIEIGYEPEVLDGLREEIAAGSPRTIEGVHRRKDGTTFPVEVRVGLLESEGDRLMLALVRDITERKEAEKKVWETETRYRTLVEQIPAITYIQDPRTRRIRYVSPQVEDVLGYPADGEMLDREHWTRMMHPEDRERVSAERERTSATGEPFRMEYRQFARDGRRVWIRDEAILVRDEDGRPLYWQGIKYDITEQKRIEAELRQSERRYRTFIGESTEGIWRFELGEPLPVGAPESEQLGHFYRHAYLDECNDAMAKMHGYRRAGEIVRMPIRDLLSRSEQENVEYLRTFIRSGYQLTNAETVEFDRNGNRRVFLNNLTGVVEDGHLVRAWGTQRDVTERRRAEEELRESEERFRATFEQAAVGMIQVGLEGQWLRFNDKFCDITGYTREELKEVSVFELITGDEFEEDFERGVRMLAGEIRDYTEEKLIVGKDGRKVWLNLTVSLVYDADDEPLYFIAVAEDISQRKWAEEALQMSETRFRTVIEQSPLSIQIFSPDGHTLRVNLAWEELWGTTMEELGDYNVLEDQQLVEKGVMQYLLRGFSGEPTRIPPIMYDPEESIPESSRHYDHRRWVQAYIYPVKDEAGEIREVVLVHEDVTERRRAEDELARLASFPMLNPNPIIETSIAGVPTYLNPAAEARFPDVRALGVRHSALADLEDAYEGIRSSDGRPFVREVRVGDRYYQQVITRTPEGDLLRIYTTDTTERRRAEDAVRESEERFRSLVQNASDIIVVLDAAGTILYESPAIERVLGYTPEERVGTNLLDHIHQDDLERVSAAFARFAERGAQHAMVEYRARARDGAWHNFEVVGTNLLDDPLIGGLVVNARDITERKLAEEELRESEERFRATFDQAAVGVALVGLDGSWLRVNDKLLDIVGYTFEEMRGLTFQDITHPDDLQDGLRGVSRMLEGETPTYSTEKRYFKKNGSIVWLNLTVSLVRDASGEPGYFVTVIEDISQRKRAEEALRQSEELYRTVVEQAAENIFVVDVEDRRILEANPALSRSLGYTTEEIREMNLYEIVAHDRESVDRNMERIIREGSSVIGERRYRRKDGAMVDVEVTASAISYQGRQALCVVAHDITERKRTLEAIQNAREAERGRIARDLHDDILQNLVYALQEIQVLQITSQDGGDPALEDTADALRRSVEGLRVAIFELRLGETVELSLASSLKSLLELNRRMSRNRYAIDLSISDEFPPKLPERTCKELVRIIQEAMNNVRRHAAPTHARVRLGIDGETAWVEIIDNGKGFVPELSEGGVGMSAMKRRAQDLGGTLSITSRLGEGSRVRFETSLECLTRADID